jgi:RNA polymerase sigma-70 factor (ECF subfamily)
LSDPRSEIQRWMCRLADGERGAFQPLFQALWPMVRDFVRRQLATEAEDVAQEALVKVFERATEFDPELDALAWVLGIAAYEVRTARHRVRRRREDEPLEVAQRTDPARGPDEVVIAAELEQAAAEIMGTLRPDDLDTLRRLASGDRLRTAAFRKRVQRALERLRAAWRARHGA